MFVFLLNKVQIHEMNDEYQVKFYGSWFESLKKRFPDINVEKNIETMIAPINNKFVLRILEQLNKELEKEELILYNVNIRYVPIKK